MAYRAAVTLLRKDQFRSTFFGAIVKRTSTVVFYHLYSYRSQKWHHKIVQTKRAKLLFFFFGWCQRVPTLGLYHFVLLWNISV